MRASQNHSTDTRPSQPKLPLILPELFEINHSTPPLAKEPPTTLKDELSKLGQSPMLQWHDREALKTKVRESHKQIARNVAAHNAQIIPRTQAHNRKCERQTVESERTYRGDVLGEQIRVWRKMLPNLIKKFSKIPDPRRAKSLSHKITVLMMFGLFAFIFKLHSRREMNRDLTSAVINENLRKIFPELDSIPHADTLARMLKRINPNRIEAIHVGLIQDLIRKKKFKNLLINGCLPVAVDGTQKLYRDGVLQDPRWCERMVGSGETKHKQQYVYVIEANITLKNGLTIPLMTEYLYRTNNQLEQPKGKQDNEITAFERLATRIKEYLPKQKIIFFMDAMYATFNIMDILKENKWEFIINLPKNKFTKLAKIINHEKRFSVPAPEQEFWRERKQEFYWKNNLDDDEARDLKVHLVGCSEEYEDVDSNTGEIKKLYSEHVWISSVMISLKNVHELLNLGARKKGLIEDSINTEKNRGYLYKHAFSYDMNAMRGFHYLMRLGHAINAISEFSRKLKHYVKSFGVSATLKLIRDSLFNPWFSNEWYETCRTRKPRLQLE